MHTLHQLDGVVPLEQDERRGGRLITRLVGRGRHLRLDQVGALRGGMERL